MDYNDKIKISNLLNNISFIAYKGKHDLYKAHHDAVQHILPYNSRPLNEKMIVCNRIFPKFISAWQEEKECIIKYLNGLYGKAAFESSVLSESQLKNIMNEYD